MKGLKKKKWQGTFSPLFPNQLTGTSCLLGPNCMMGINEPVLWAPIRSCQMSPPPPVPQACQSSRPLFIQPVKVLSRPSSLGTVRRAQNSQHRQLSTAIPLDGIVPSDPPHCLLCPQLATQHPSFLRMCCFNVSGVGHPQVYHAIVNSTQVKGADPGAVFPDWP